MTAAEFFLRAILDCLELAARESHGRAKATALTFQIGFSNLGAIDLARTFLKTQHAAEHDSIRNAETFAVQLAYRARNLPAVVLLKFVKIAREKADNRIQCFLFVFAVRNDAEVGAATRGQGQDAENRLRVGFRAAVETLQRETAFELARHAYEVGGGACM